MSTIINGSAANVTTPLTRTILSLSSGTGGVVRVQTSAAHLFGPSDFIYFHGTGLSALDRNFFFISAIIDSTHFEVAGTTYTATATGAVQDYSLTPQFQWPTSGDGTDAQLSGLLSGCIMLASYSQYLAQQLEFTKANSFQPILFADPALTTTDGRWYAANAGYDQTVGGTPGPVLQATISTIPGDVVEFGMSVSLATHDTAAAHVGSIRAEFIDGYTGSGSTVGIVSSEQDVEIPLSSTPVVRNTTILSAVQVAAGGTLAIFLNGNVSATSTEFSIDKGTIQYRVFRKVV